MTRLKNILVFVTSALIYLFILPEVLFRFLSRASYHVIVNLTNPFNLFGSTANSLIVALVVCPLLLAGLTVFLINKAFTKK